jgi:queuine tRNA-ribosyltransferase
MPVTFQLEKTDSHSKARAGLLRTAHGVVQTPMFMPVGTSANVKAIHVKELSDDVKAQIILGNTYHLYLRPGNGIMHKAGGLHSFMNWQKPVLTDSGGYQVFSLSARRKIKAEGVIFNSHIDGSKHFFTPENVVDTQRYLGSDLMMVLDECPPYPVDKKYADKSLQLTNRWLDIAMNYFSKTESLYGFDQCLVPICQGSVFEDLRIASILFVKQYESPVYAIGGLSVGEPETELNHFVKLSCNHLPENSARYLMGVGNPRNILNSIESGIDLFDCVLPTRNARHGILYTTNGIVHIKNAKWQDDFFPIDSGLDLESSQRHTKAYLRHLFMSKEILAAQLASLQNVRFFIWLVEEARKHILQGDFASWKNEILLSIDQKL